MGDDHVSTEHLLLAITRYAGGGGARVLAELGVDVGRLREEVESAAAESARASRDSARTTLDLPYESAAQRAIEMARDEAAALHHARVGTEHLLLGVMRAPGGAQRALLDAGVTLEHARAAVVAEVARKARPPFRVVLDGRADRPVDEQIVARVREGVAAGRLAPGDRLPTLQQLAAELDVAPSVVAAAYEELARLGVVVADPPAGARVASCRRPAVPAEQRPQVLADLLRPRVVAAFNLGASAQELRDALEATIHEVSNPPRSAR
jgi:ATP-dependent Clp protease ATP-binding subunit ClpC